ncbi:MAG: aconitate hydratase AcnA [Proteobacteria bacterium]|nr:aconitate hydratase AcnA [Pseudomonadota bacterium]MDA1356044.1 aconitate hydratase AcnA [Pseudomonadota bacterium]
MIALGQDTLKTRRTLTVGGRSYDYFSLAAAESAGLGDISRLPYSLKVLLENLLRFEDGKSVTVADIKGLAAWLKERRSTQEINFRPARVLMQDFTGVPAVVDLAAMRAAMSALGGDPKKINPLSPVDLVIDHSVMVDRFASSTALRDNTAIEMERNGERYSFLRWGQQAFSNFRVVPPGTGICHQVNLEHLAQVVWTAESDGATIAYPDTLVGTDSHTTMINGLAVLGWGVGGIEAEAAMLGQPISMLVPEVVGFRLAGRLAEGATATDLVLTVVQMLRKKGVVGKFVEFYGPGLDELSLADQATIANMAPEYGATCGFFPIDAEAINYLRLTARDPDRIALVEAYAKAQGLWRDADTPDPVFTDSLELELGSVMPSIAGPKRPQDKIFLTDAASAFGQALSGELGVAIENSATEVAVAGMDHALGHGDVVIAAITSCTNTSNPSVMLGAGLLARNAVKRGLKVKPWVKTSLAPGSKVVSEYLAKAGLQDDLNALGFNVVGYGCTTCIGNSGPLADEIVTAIDAGELVVTSVLSGNRNFEGRISPHVRANYLASPPLVVAYAIAGSMNVDITTEPLGEDGDGVPVYLKDIWPGNDEVRAAIAQSVSPEMFSEQYADVFTGSAEWQAIDAPQGLTYEWQDGSTYVKNPPYFEGIQAEPAALEDVTGARILALLGDSVTTDHISPAGSIKYDSPGGAYLTERQVAQADFNSYGSRRGNHEVMMRGTFANVRIRNEMAPGTEGGVTRHMPDGRAASMFDAAADYAGTDTPLVVIAGKEYGTGSSRDWAAKGTRLLGVKAVIAESFERIHRSNLVGMGVLPLLFPDGVTRHTLALDGSEVIDLSGVAGGVSPGMTVACRITRANGAVESLDLNCRIDTAEEAEYFRHGGILHYVLRGLAGLT